jgi:DNA-binding winged helix-turn-helix (wHTH) protein/tetratricopeptide (TPR) repeat protein
LQGSSTIGTAAAELAGRQSFWLGDTLIAPASREVKGPGGQATIEPRVMQVLLALSDAGGAVLTRDDLLRICWNSQIVGEDALNRAVAEVRRVARDLAAGGFSVETIPRTGYRLVGPAATPATTAATPAPPALWTSRRLVAGAAVLAVAGAAGGLAIRRPWEDDKARRARELATRATLATVDGLAPGATRGIALLTEAVALRPRDAALWGQLALARRTMTELSSPGETAAAVQACEAAAARALALDPRQPDARLALILLGSSYGDWLIVEQKLRAVLADAPDNVEGLAELGFLLKSVGRDAEAMVANGAAAARAPLSPVYQFRRAYHLWSLGRLEEADRTIDRAIELWPRHPGVWFARLWLSGFTGRAPAAVAQIDDIEARPASISPANAALLRQSMEAIASRRPAAVEAAATANLAAARAGPGGSINAIMILSGLGRLDDAFTVANGYLLRRGPDVMPLRPTPTQPVVNDQSHRKTQILFIPVTAALRDDPRFEDICRGCGLIDYWRKSGHRADFLNGRSVAWAPPARG